jgi:DNA-binding CsgD family transcriptional regulator
VYIRINTPYANSSLFYAVEYFGAFIAKYVLMFTIPIVTHAFFSVPHLKIKNAIWGTITIITAGIAHIAEFAIHNNTLERAGDYIVKFAFISVIIYSFLINLYHHKKPPKNERGHHLSTKILILIGIFLPGLISDTFKLSPILFFPLFYCGFSVIFTYYLIRNYSLQYQTSKTDQISSNTLPDEKVFEKYNISPREKEIISLILQGYSNHKIGETLFISLNTVKTHIRNIYAKLDIKSRYELIALLRNTGGDFIARAETHEP